MDCLIPTPPDLFNESRDKSAASNDTNLTSKSSIGSKDTNENDRSPKEVTRKSINFDAIPTKISAINKINKVNLTQIGVIARDFNNKMKMIQSTFIEKIVTTPKQKQKRSTCVSPNNPLYDPTVQMDYVPMTYTIHKQPGNEDIILCQVFNCREPSYIWCELTKHYLCDTHKNVRVGKKTRFHEKKISEHDTPTRGRERAEAAQAQQLQAKRMNKRSKQDEHLPVLELGTIVLVPVDKVDRSKVDFLRIPGIIVEITLHERCRIAVKGGVIKFVIGREGFVIDTNKTAASYGLVESYINWRTAKKISLREAMSHISAVGGQGFTQCHCKGNCLKNICSCLKAGLKCNSRCHPSSRLCCNN